MLAVETMGGNDGGRFSSKCGGVACGPGDPPASAGEPAGQCLCTIAEAKAEQTPTGHDYERCSAAAVMAGTGGGASGSRAAAMAFCLNRVQAQNPQETSAPIASGRRSPKCSLAEPITTAP